MSYDMQAENIYILKMFSKMVPQQNRKLRLPIIYSFGYSFENSNAFKHQRNSLVTAPSIPTNPFEYSELIGSFEKFFPE